LTVLPPCGGNFDQRVFRELSKVCVAKKWKRKMRKKERSKTNSCFGNVEDVLTNNYPSKRIVYRWVKICKRPRRHQKRCNSFSAVFSSSNVSNFVSKPNKATERQSTSD